jgi:hypothetical protein
MKLVKIKVKDCDNCPHFFAHDWREKGVCLLLNSKIIKDSYKILEKCPLPEYNEEI